MGMGAFALLLLASSVGARPSRRPSAARPAPPPRVGLVPYATSPSSLYPLPRSVSAPRATPAVAGAPPCTFTPLLSDTFSPGCADGGAYCAPGFATASAAQAACAVDPRCQAVTSSPNSTAPWTLRKSLARGGSPSGEASSYITNAFACRPPAPPPNCALVDPAAFAIEWAAGSFEDDVTAALAARYKAQLFSAGTSGLSRPTGAPFRTATSVVLNVTTRDDRLRFGIDEAYSLAVSRAGIAVAAPTVFGAGWALETLSTLVHRVWTTLEDGAPGPSWYQVCDAEVEDAPRFPYRGVMLDAARHFLTPTVLRQAIDALSALKLNALHLHLTDDSSWPLFIPALPNVTNFSAFSLWHVYRPEDLAALVQYGRERGVIVYPEIDLPAHSSALRAAIPGFGCLQSSGARALVDPAFPALWEVLAAVWGAMAAAFPPEYPFHIGADEVYTPALDACPSAVAWAAARNCTGPCNVGYFVVNAFEKALFEMLTAPPFSRELVIAWEDVLWDPSWRDASTKLALMQWNQAQWQSDTCTCLTANTSVIVAGPFSVGEVATLNHGDIFNVSCAPLTPRQQQQLIGPHCALGVGLPPPNKCGKYCHCRPLRHHPPTHTHTRTHIHTTPSPPPPPSSFLAQTCCGTTPLMRRQAT